MKTVTIIMFGIIYSCSVLRKAFLIRRKPAGLKFKKFKVWKKNYKNL
jgi:hypothetical protein